VSAAAPIRATETVRFYGAPIGILLADCNAPFVPGSVGNASSYSLPVRFAVMPGCTIPALLAGHDEANERSVVDTARAVVAQGARMLAANCGFTLRYQHAVRAAVDVPVFLSSLLQVPLLTSTLPPSRSLGVLTASAEHLTPELLALAGGADVGRLVIRGLEHAPAFRAAMIDCVGSVDVDAVRGEVVDGALAMVHDHPEIGALLLECSEFPPYAAAVQEATGLPVYDYLSMIEYFAGGLRRSRFEGYL
jgi:hypothetical protein